MSKKKETRTDKAIMQIKLAFKGALFNLIYLEEKLLEIENIPIYQYCNYLSHISLCIEIGLKSIIINSDDYEHEHELNVLFLATPSAFQKNIKNIYSDNEKFSILMSKTLKIFEHFRYYTLESNFNEYLDHNMINDDKTIKFKNADYQENVIFLKIFINEIVKYEENIRMDVLE